MNNWKCAIRVVNHITGEVCEVSNIHALSVKVIWNRLAEMISYTSTIMIESGSGDLKPKHIMFEVPNNPKLENYLNNEKVRRLFKDEVTI